MRVCRALATIAALGLAVLALWRFGGVPNGALERYPESLRIVDRGGGELRAILGEGGVRCEPVAIGETGPWAAPALIAAEDKRFLRHAGVDPVAVLRAVLQNVAGGRVVSGASTLTTQVVRMVEPRRRTLAAKLLEAAGALRVERRLDKRRILEQYLNRAPFGGNLTGLQAASRYYFGRSASDLSLAEAALLVGLPQSPARLRPDRHPERAGARRRYVLGRMAALGFITPAQRREAEAMPVTAGVHPAPFRAPHFCDLALREAANAVAIRRPDDSSVPAPTCLGAERLRRSVGMPSRDRVEARYATRTRQAFRYEEAAGEVPGRAAAPLGHRHAVLRTTLDPDLQRAAEDEVRLHAAGLRAQGIHGAALVVIEVATGSVRAMVGSPDYGDARHAGQVNGALALRSPGSALKPFVYALAFDQGGCTPGTVIPDVPMRFRDYRPENFALTFAGLVTAREALVQSLNIPALAVTQSIGLEDLADVLRRVGLSSIDRPCSQYGLTLALGTAEVTLIDLANAYACLARLGEFRPWRIGEDGPGAPGARVISRAAAYLVADVLGGEERAFALTAHTADVRLPRVAWKTGTSTGFRDAWAIAYNPEYVVGVWAGNPDGTPAAGLVGIEAAAPLAYRVFRRLYPDGAAPWYARPASVAARRVCAASGMPPNPWCPDTREELCIAGISDPAPCGVHRLCAGGADGAGTVREVWPPEIAAGLAAAGVRAVNGTADGAGDAAEPAGAPPAGSCATLPGGPRPPGAGESLEASLPLRMTSPQDGTTYRFAEDLPPGAQTLQLQANPGASGELAWFVDGQLLGRAPAARGPAWPLQRGRHVIACAADNGAAARAAIVVE